MGLWLFGTVPLLGFFLINVVFILVTHSGTCAPCKHLFLFSTSLSWMELNFLNPCILLWPGVFQFDMFSVFFSRSMRISAFGHSSSSSRILAILFIHSAFSLCFLIAVFSSQIVRCLWHPVVGMFSCHALPVVDTIFFPSLGNVLFCLYFLPFVDISLISLLSPVLSGLLFKFYCFFHALPFPFCSHIFQHLSFVLSFSSVFVDFLSAFPVEFPFLALTVSSCFLRECQFSHKLISPLQRLVPLTRLYYSLICKVVLDLFYSTLFQVFSILCFFMMVN